MVAVRFGSGLSVFSVASPAEDNFGPKAQKNKYQAIRDEIKKAKAEEEKDREGLWDGSEAKLDNERVLRCKILAHHYIRHWAVGKLLRSILDDIYTSPTAIASTSNSSSGNARAAT